MIREIHNLPTPPRLERTQNGRIQNERIHKFVKSTGKSLQQPFIIILR